MQPQGFELTPPDARNRQDLLVRSRPNSFDRTERVEQSHPCLGTDARHRIELGSHSAAAPDPLSTMVREAMRLIASMREQKQLWGVGFEWDGVLLTR